MDADFRAEELSDREGPGHCWLSSFFRPERINVLRARRFNAEGARPRAPGGGTPPLHRRTISGRHYPESVLNRSSASSASAAVSSPAGISRESGPA